MANEKQVRAGVASSIINRSQPIMENKFNLLFGDSMLLTFDEIVSNLFYITIALEHCHRQTKNEPLHRAFGEAYEEVNDIKDKVIEFTIGYKNGENYENLYLKPIGKYDFVFAKSVAEDICTFSEKLTFFAKLNKYLAIDNLAQDLSGIGALLKFKLGLDGKF